MTIRWLILLAELLTHYIYQAISCLIIELLIKTKALVPPIESLTPLTKLSTIIYSKKNRILHLHPFSLHFHPLPLHSTLFSRVFIITSITILQEVKRYYCLIFLNAALYVIYNTVLYQLSSFILPIPSPPFSLEGVHFSLHSDKAGSPSDVSYLSSSPAVKTISVCFMLPDSFFLFPYVFFPSTSPLRWRQAPHPSIVCNGSKLSE